MEFDSNILDIQRKVNNLQSEFGNLREADISPEKLAGVIEKWNKVIVKSDDALKRKIHMYLVLNTDFPVLSSSDEVSASDDIAHVAKTAPAISPRLLVSLVKGCNLLSYAYETITFADPVLSLEYSKQIMQHNQTNTLDTMKDAFNLFHSLFSLLCCYQKGLVESVFKDNIIGKVGEEVVKMINNLPILLLSKLENPSEDVKVEIAGHLAKHLIQMVCSCLQVMEQPPQDKTEFYLREMFVGFEYGSWTKNSDGLTSCFEKVLEECDRNMKSVDLDIWMRWEDVQGEAKGKSLQMEIGEAAYRCTEMEYKSSPKFMELLAVLMGFKQAPVSEIEMADLDGIISALENDEEASKDWLLALLNNVGSLEDERVPDLVTKHRKFWDLEIVEALIHMASNCKKSEKVLLLVFSAFKFLELDDQKRLLENYFKTIGVSDHFKMSDFETQVTTVLNRSSNFQTMREKWLPQLLFLCLQSPKELLEKAIISGIGSRGQGVLIAAALSELDFMCSMTHNDSKLLLTALKNAIANIDPSTSHLTHLVQQLEDYKLLKAADFMRYCLLPALKQDLATYRIPHLLLWIQLLKRLLRIDGPQLVDLEGKVSLAVLLAVLAELLQCASWVLGKFRHAESLLRAETVSLIRPLACKYANSISNPEDKELLWLRSGLLRLTSHNRAHFGAIWTHFEIPVPSMNMGSLLLSREAMHQQSGMPPGGPDQLLSPLLILLPSCCTPEWRLLISTLAKVLSTYNTTDQEAEEAEERDELKMLPEAIRLLVTALMLQALMLSQQQLPDDSNYSNECALACLENSVRNLGIIMKEEWLPKLTDASEVENGAGVVRQVALLLRSLPPSISSSCSLALSGVLQQAHEVLLLQAGVQTDLATWCAQELALSLALLPDRESRQALARKLLIEPALAQI